MAADEQGMKNVMRKFATTTDSGGTETHERIRTEPYGLEMVVGHSPTGAGPGMDLGKEHTHQEPGYTAGAGCPACRNDLRHPGFAAVEAKIAREPGIHDAGAVLASRTRHASKAAHEHNPRLNRVKG